MYDSYFEEMESIFKHLDFMKRTKVKKDDLLQAAEKLRDETTAVLCVKKNGNHAACGSFDVNGTWKIG